MGDSAKVYRRRTGSPPARGERREFWVPARGEDDTASAAFPGGSLAGVLENDALCGQVVADLVGAGEVAGGLGGLAVRDQRFVRAARHNRWLCDHNGVRDAIAGGVTAVQYRDKGDDVTRRLAEARRLRALCREAGAPFIVNDDPRLAADPRDAADALSSSKGLLPPLLSIAIKIYSHICLYNIPILILY